MISLIDRDLYKRRLRQILENFDNTPASSLYSKDYDFRDEVQILYDQVSR